MYRHIRRGAAGFSFIELLVTIIIAGIAFAALVPVFVSASQKGRGDSARNVALNLAQDRIEKIRELDYDQVTESNLQSSTFSASGFGTSAPVPSGGGTKIYQVAYSVTFVGGTKDGWPAEIDTSGDGSEQYKLVSVDVYWTGNPRPVKHAVLKTIVYKQYVGSYLDSLSVSPTTQLGIPLHDFISSYTIVLTAKVNAADITNTKSVVFRVYGAGGIQLKRLVRYTTDSAYVTLGVFTQTYTILGNPGTQDGTYTFKAIAVNKNWYEGNTQTVTLPVETDKPPVPTGLAATATNRTVNLTWNKSSAGDVTSYLVYSRASSGIYGTPRTVLVVLGQVPAFTDTGLTNNTTYYYEVAAVDGLGNTSNACAEISSQPKLPTDTTPPNDVTVFSVGWTSGSTTSPPPLTLRLIWTGVTDPGSGSASSGVAKYYIYRSTVSDTFDATPTYTILAGDISYVTAGTYTFDDASGLTPLTTYYYQIKALDAAGNLSLLPANGNKQTQNYAYCPVTVKNSSTKEWASIIVTNPDGSALDTWPGITNPANSSAFDVPANGSKTWQLPIGFGFKAGWSNAKTQIYTYKPIPASGVISSPTGFTVSFP